MTKEQTFDMKSTIMLRNLFLFSLRKATEKNKHVSAVHRDMKEHSKIKITLMQNNNINNNFD